MKSSSSAKKRFKVSSSGKIKHRHAFRSHNMEHKTRKRKRSMRQDHDVSPADMPMVQKLLATRL